jgi:hypothetical protein
VRNWTGYRIGFMGWLLWTWYWTCWFCKRQGISWLGEGLSPFQELFFVKFVVCISRCFHLTLSFLMTHIKRSVRSILQDCGEVGILSGSWCVHFMYLESLLQSSFPPFLHFTMPVSYETVPLTVFVLCCEIWVSYSSEYEDGCLVECSTM